MKQIIFTFLIFFGGLSILFGQQDSSHVYLIIDADSSYYVQVHGIGVYKDVDKLFLKKRYYQMKIWAPGYLLRDTVIDITKKNQLAYIDVLTPHPDYSKYKTDLKSHKRQVIWRYVLPIGATLGASTYTYLMANQANDYHEQSLALFEDYLLTPYYYPDPDGVFSALLRTPTEARLEFEAMRDDFEIFEQKYKRGLATSITLGAISSYFLIRHKKYKSSRPTYTPQPNPFELNSFGVSYTQNTPVVYFNFQF